jgi:hypothetical protein
MSRSVRAVSIATALAACVAVTLLTWHASHYFFLYDDFALVAVAGGSSWKTLATTPQIGFFRPLPFLIMRAEFGVVHWASAYAYAFEAVLIHVTNAALVGVLAATIGLRRRVAFTAAVLFLLSAASGEGYFWLSSTFDRLCVLGTVIALVAGVSVVSATTNRTSWAWACAALLGSVVALLSKESGVVLPVLSLATFVMAGVPLRLRAMSYVGLQAALVLSLLLYREHLLPGLGGAYGQLGSLWGQANVPANLMLYARSIVHLPLPWHDTTWLIGRLAATANVLSAAGWFVILVTVGLRRPTALGGALVGALVAIVPVAWVRLLPGTTASGRLLYLPGIFVALLPALALDFDESTPRRLVHSITTVAVIVILCVQTASVLYQARIWRLGSHLSFLAMEEMRPYGKFDRPLYVENMPAFFIEGPLVLKDYAFPLYFGSAFKPRVRARGMALKVDNGRPAFSGWLETDGPRPDERVVRLRVLDGSYEK